jgi:hypothetical protein
LSWFGACGATRPYADACCAGRLQLLLGIANVLWLRPLPVALAHHVLAMLLLALALGLLCRLQPVASWRGRIAVRPSPPPCWCVAGRGRSGMHGE